MKEESEYRKNLKERAGIFAVQILIPLLSYEQKDLYSRQVLTKFVDELKFNVVFDAGFNISCTDALGQDFCYCPMSSLFSTLHKRFNNNLI